MPKKNPLHKAALDRYQQPWITDGAWISGITGVVSIILLAYVFSKLDILKQGFGWIEGTADQFKYQGMLLALSIITVSMTVVELIRLWRFNPNTFICKDPLVEAGNYNAFFWLCMKHYLLLLMLFWLCKIGYHSVSEYGFRANNRYYQPWFYTLDVLWQLFLVCGLPYILLTRAFKYNPEADKKSLTTLTEKCLMLPVFKLFGAQRLKPKFNINDKRAALGLAVKFFFAPVITIFFFDNFNNLVNNFDYLRDGFVSHLTHGTYTRKVLGNDLLNISTAFIFTIDVGLAWVGYIVSSRWVDNQTVSAEPTLLGWLVCLISYPPFRIIGGWFFTGPGEKLFMQLPNQMLVGVLGCMMLISYFVYMLPTIWFGVRFSNLTHRGIIRKGPFSVVRHPAYAAKNFGWWCVGFPVAVYACFTSGLTVGLFYIAGLVFLTGVYYLRALTEERHLSFDPDYVEYCHHVKYRFFPKLI